MKNVLYLAVEFKDENDLVDNVIKAAMEAEDLWLLKKGPAAKIGDVLISIETEDGKDIEKKILYDIEIGQSEAVSLCNLFPDDSGPSRPTTETSDTAEIPVVTGDAELAQTEMAVA